jgi:predicted ArsR family transcriptional regulator
MRDTRRRVLELLRQRTALTVDEIAREIHVTRTAAVSHLGALLSQGLAHQTGFRPGKRRPSTLYGLTDDADRLFAQEYDTLAIGIVSELKRSAPRKFQSILERVAGQWASADLPSMKNLKGKARVERATVLLAERGLMPAIEGNKHGYVLRQYHCPIQRVGSVHPEVCLVMQRWIQALYGARVKRLGCTSLGDSHCSYAIGGAPASRANP